ncbi:acyl-CoA reductase [Kiloniella laminariae]|uniref:acyl-CoA reductase n=1 Tax=Kiloniella laminariae TaxID=454162 RepID=UPI0003719532|nr:acyl-CoA reductase [Kiloniella laminariae]
MKVKKCAPTEETIELAEIFTSKTIGAKAVPAFSESIINFCAHLSDAIGTEPNLSHDPELAALAFWLRKKNISSLAQKDNEPKKRKTHKSPKGVVFLIPPTNVGSLFCYQLVLSLLTGNRTLIRVSPNAPVTTITLCRLLRDLCKNPAYKEIAQSFDIFSYRHETEITAALSQSCDLRVIWGGDETINEIRKIPLAAKAAEISFSDRFSWAAVKATSYLEASDSEKQQLAQRLASDLMLFDQKACSSPKAFCWIGGKKDINSATAVFWGNLTKEIGKRPAELCIGNAVEKLDNIYTILALVNNCRLETHSPFLSTLKLNQPKVDTFDLTRDLHQGNGLLLEIRAKSLGGIQSLISKKDQTLSHYGFDGKELTDFLDSCTGNCFDRIVPIGQSHIFSEIWDGYNMIDAYQRTITLSE